MKLEDFNKVIQQMTDLNRILIVFGKDFTARGRFVEMWEGSGFLMYTPVLKLTHKNKTYNYKISDIVKIELDEEPIPRGSTKKKIDK